MVVAKEEKNVTNFQFGDNVALLLATDGRRLRRGYVPQQIKGAVLNLRRLEGAEALPSGIQIQI
jgi:hypothetical protein